MHFADLHVTSNYIKLCCVLSDKSENKQLLIIPITNLKQVIRLSLERVIQHMQWVFTKQCTLLMYVC